MAGEPMAYSQGGGKKKVCYYYDGETPGRREGGRPRAVDGMWQLQGCGGRCLFTGRTQELPRPSGAQLLSSRRLDSYS